MWFCIDEVESLDVLIGIIGLLGRSRAPVRAVILPRPETMSGPDADYS